jgi:hypothetical protein
MLKEGMDRKAMHSFPYSLAMAESLVTPELKGLKTKKIYEMG